MAFLPWHPFCWASDSPCVFKRVVLPLFVLGAQRTRQDEELTDGMSGLK